MIKELLGMYQERMVTIAEMAENARFFFEDPAIDLKALEKFVKSGGGVQFLQQTKAILDPLSDWSKSALADPMDKILNLGTETGGKRGAAAQPLRVALSGNTITPPMLETIALLGREKTLARIEKLLQSVGVIAGSGGQRIKRAAARAGPESARFHPAGALRLPNLSRVLALIGQLIDRGIRWIFIGWRRPALLPQSA